MLSNSLSVTPAHYKGMLLPCASARPAETRAPLAVSCHHNQLTVVQELARPQSGPVGSVRLRLGRGGKQRRV